MKKIKKTLRFLLYTLIVIVILLIASLFCLGTIIKNTTERVGPLITKTPITMSDCTVYPLRAFVEISSFVIGNPEGFKSDFAFKVDTVRIDIDETTLLSDVIVIDEVIIAGVDIIYEQQLTNPANNLTTILSNLQGSEHAQEVKETTPSADNKKSSKPTKIVVKKFRMLGAHVEASVLGQTVSLPLPDLIIDNLGGDVSVKSKTPAGITPIEAVEKVFIAIIQSVVKGLGNLAGVATDAVMDGAGKASGAVINSIKNIF